MLIIKQPKTKEEFKNYYALRYRVLRESLGQPKGTEKDDYEPISIHFMAVDKDSGEIVGVVKLFEKEPGVGQFSHMAVAENRQHQGIGKMLINAVEVKAKELGYKTLGTTIRINSTNFYEKCGYKMKGLAYVLFGRVQLLWMEKELND